MRIVIKYLYVIIVIILASPSCINNSAEIIEKPNILLISIDDLNNWIEPMGGHPQSLTPNLAAFAGNAVMFNNAYCASPSCNPSRTALFTGKHTYVTGLYNNPQVWRDVVNDELTLPEYFMNHGYWTGGAGKIYHGNMPDPRSWNEYYPSKIKHMPDYYLPAIDSVTGDTLFRMQDNEIREDDPKGITFNMPYFKGMYVAFDWAPVPYSTGETGDFSSVRWIIDQLDSKHDKPFFLACGLYRPHLPWYVPQEYYDKFPIDSIKLPNIYNEDWEDLPELARRTANGRYHRQVTDAGQWEEAVQGYLASINYADHLAGTVLDALERSEYAENTIVVIFSDHGWQLGEKQHWRKFALWENVINSVLMIRVPKGSKGLPEGSRDGITCFSNVSLLDIFPTLTELCGLPSKEGITGESLIPFLEKPDSLTNRAIISTLGHNHYSVRKEEWHYIIYDNKEEELYNLKTDPEEWYNLAGRPESKEVVEDLKEYLPKEPHELVPTRSIRWKDVLSGKVKF
ncbi:MAG TPA: sulfatase [Bacteroidales bacterium]|nr:sulfatase [Bacteroidales bacterium]